MSKDRPEAYIQARAGVWNGQTPSAFQDTQTLRDYFAGHALQGYLAGELDIRSFKSIPKLCYELADLMLKARETPNVTQ